MNPANFIWLDFGFEFDDPYSLAEIIELMLIADQEPFLAASELRTAFPTGNQPSDAQMTFAFNVIADRRAKMGRHYPFRKQRRGIKFASDGPWRLYAFLLLLSFKNTPMRAASAYRTSDPIFDGIVLRAFKRKLGPGTEGLVFGFPARDGRPTNFADAVEWVATRLGVDLREDKKRISTDKNDDGVDVILWTPFADGDTGYPVILVQNTIQQSFSGKPRDILPDRWREWLRIGAAPVVGFAIPFAVPQGDKRRDDVVAVATYFFDRGRLIENLKAEDPTTWPEWADLMKFVDNELTGSAAATGVRPVGARKKKGRKAAP